jgi:repressor LexA
MILFRICGGEYADFILLVSTTLDYLNLNKKWHNIGMGDSNQNKESIRPTKKQAQTLEFIKTFISEHGYSPSYREIMNSLNYNSVATVALHVNSLLKRGHLRKRDRSARSLEVIESTQDKKIPTNLVAPSEEKWLVEKIEHAFKQVEDLGDEIKTTSIDHLYVLVGALRVLGLEGAAQSFIPRLSDLKKKQSETS